MNTRSHIHETETFVQGATACDGTFGKVRLGYVVIESNHVQEWHRFLADGMGMHANASDSQTLSFRLDEHQSRFVVQRGGAEDIAGVGFHVADSETLALIIFRLRALGIEVDKGCADEAVRHGVEAFVSFEGPKRQRIELFTTPLLAAEPLSMLNDGFVTGSGGMGHLAITSRRPEEMIAFWQQVFEARISDRIEARISGVDLDIAFLRLNDRHHSIAVAATRGVRLDPIRTRVQHINIQSSTLEGLTNAYVRCQRLGYRMALAMGQHTNDRELSFYAVGPSGFEVELGWNPIVVDESAWLPVVHQGISLWGHKPQGQTIRHKLGEFQRGLASLRRIEHAVALALKAKS